MDQVVMKLSIKKQTKKTREPKANQGQTTVVYP